MLVDTIELLLKDLGFSEDMYIIRDQGDDVYIEVDEYDAAQYILKMSKKESYCENIVGQYSKNGKRHRISFFMW
jgi:hypothetical protein